MPTATSSNKIKIGFIPLTDCASVVIAHELGLYKKHGVDVEVSREASWATIRDKVLSGDLQGAHCLFGMPFSVYTGVGGQAGSEMHIAMILNNNGQAITLSKEFCGKVGFREVGKVKAAVEALKQKKSSAPWWSCYARSRRSRGSRLAWLFSSTPAKRRSLSSSSRHCGRRSSILLSV